MARPYPRTYRNTSIDESLLYLVTCRSCDWRSGPYAAKLLAHRAAAHHETSAHGETRSASHKWLQRFTQQESA